MSSDPTSTEIAATVEAVADARKVRTVAAIPEGEKFATRAEVARAIAGAARIDAEAVDALRGIERAQTVIAACHILAIVGVVVGVVILIRKL